VTVCAIQLFDQIKPKHVCLPVWLSITLLHVKALSIFILIRQRLGCCCLFVVEQVWDGRNRCERCSQREVSSSGETYQTRNTDWIRRYVSLRAVQ